MQRVIQHGQPREELFNPGDAEMGPRHLKSWWSIRKTEGIMKDGRKFSITDEWNEEPTRERKLRQSWTGTITFICRTSSNKISKMSNAQQ